MIPRLILVRNSKTLKKGSGKIWVQKGTTNVQLVQ